MKKLLMAVSVAAISTSAMADNDVGCGLGTQVFAGQSGKVSKVLAATTNGTFGNQTFGITFGTLGCSGDGVITASARTTMFINNNAETLARDISVGSGESLNVLAALMGVEKTKQAHFNAVAKANFATIYAPENKTTGQVYEAIKTVVANDSVLSAS